MGHSSRGTEPEGLLLPLRKLNHKKPEETEGQRRPHRATQRAETLQDGSVAVAAVGGKEERERGHRPAARHLCDLGRPILRARAGDRCPRGRKVFPPRRHLLPVLLHVVLSPGPLRPRRRRRPDLLPKATIHPPFPTPRHLRRGGTALQLCCPSVGGGSSRYPMLISPVSFFSFPRVLHMLTLFNLICFPLLSYES